MARMPGAVWLGEKSPGTPMSRYDVVCVHTIVGFAPAHQAHFSVKADGTIQQSRDTRFRSAANLDGNHRVISIENEDHGARFGGTPRLPGWVPLTPEQVAANARILAWANKEHGIPLQLCPDSRPSSRGLGYHRQGIDGNFAGFKYPGRVSGGERWTEHFGKVCPTDIRIDQLPEILARAKGDPIPTKSEEDDMPTPEQLWSHPIPVYEGKNGPKTRRAQVVVAQTHSRATSAVDLANECAKGIKDLAGLVGNTGLSEKEKADLAKQVADRTSAAVQRLDAAAVAEQLEVTVKEDGS